MSMMKSHPLLLAVASTLCVVGAARFFGSSSSKKKNKVANPSLILREVQEYVMKIGLMESEAAKVIREKTVKEAARPNMMGDPIEAALFSVMLPAMGAKRVLEVGVFTGYTTQILAEAVGPDGIVVAMDVDDTQPKAIGEPYWKESGVRDRIDLRIAPATETLQQLIDDGQAGTYDFCFIDADKASYKNYYELSLKLLKPNGVIAIDNVLWGKRVLDPVKYNDNDTNAIREVSAHVHNDDRVVHVLLPMADGVSLVRKK